MSFYPAFVRIRTGFSILLFALISVPLLAFPSLSYPETLIRSGGSTTVLPVVSRAAARYSQDHPGIRITVSGGGSGVGVQGVGSGLFDIGLVSREMTSQEKTKFQKRGLQVHAIGRDAVACVVSSEIYEAGVKALTREQIRQIYEGRIQNWREVGGPDRHIVVIDKERHRGTRHVFMNYIFGDPKARARGARLVTGSNNEEQAKIAQSDSAIGMLSFAWMNKEVRGLGLNVDGHTIQPTVRNVENGSYPIVRNLNLLLPASPLPEARGFLNFVLGEKGQAIVKNLHYIPVHRREGSHIAGSQPGHQ